MPTFAEWEAARKGGAPAADANPTADPSAPGYNDWYSGNHPEPSSGVVQVPGSQSENEGGIYHPGLKDSPLGAAARSFGDSVSESGLRAISGVTSHLNPWNLVKGVFGLPSTVKQIGSGLKTLVQDPSLLKEAPAYYAQHPEEAGGALGDLILGDTGPDMVKAGVEAAPGAATAVTNSVGRGVSKVGRGAEALGKSGALRAVSKYGPLEAIMRMDPKGLALAAAPDALEYGGRGLQRIGGKLEGADFNRAPAPEGPPAGWSSQSSEVPYRGRPQKPGLTADDPALYRETVDMGMDPKAALRTVAGPQRASQAVLQQMVDAGMKARAGQTLTNADLEAAPAINDHAWDSNLSAQATNGPNVPGRLPNGMTPMEDFYAKNPMGEGRTVQVPYDPNMGLAGLAKFGRMSKGIDAPNQFGAEYPMGDDVTPNDYADTLAELSRRFGRMEMPQGKQP